MQNHTLLTSLHQGRECSRAAGVKGHRYSGLTLKIQPSRQSLRSHSSSFPPKDWRWGPRLLLDVVEEGARPTVTVCRDRAAF